MARSAEKRKSDETKLNSAEAAADKLTGQAAKKSPAKQSTSAKSTASSRRKNDAGDFRKQDENEIFALDIGTRNVVGIVGHMDGGTFCVDHSVSVPHTQRAMVDGQIEDIPEVARVSGVVKSKLEEMSGIALERVSIAAAGRALKTRRVELSFDVEDKEMISEDDVRSYELETALKAQDELDTETADSGISFYCVGHTVIQYLLDDYKIKSLIGHKGRKITVELIAAFLPSSVVESLYAVMDMSGLEVASLTLEPIAAMNIIIPPEVRLINIALVDIGAGTSDIAISQNGSIVAYAMSTVAGDEITEEIIRKYIVDFTTAENMKLSANQTVIGYTDILGFEHTIEKEKFLESINTAVEQLASDISENIIKANGQAPAAVFLVGGGSLIPGLAENVAGKLGIPGDRVAVGSKNVMKNVSFGNSGISGPEYVTPVGIGVTATNNKGYDFSVVTLNGKKLRIFDTRSIRILDLLMSAGYKSAQIIGRSGRNLSFTLNGEKKVLKGELATAAEVTLNGEPAALETNVKQGDTVDFVPAESGKNAETRISDVAGDVSERYVLIDGTRYDFGVLAEVNGKKVTSDYMIQNFDSVTVSEIETLGDLMQVLPFDTSLVGFYKAGKQLAIDYYLRDNDDIVTGAKSSENSKIGNLAKSFAEDKTIEALEREKRALEAAYKASWGEAPPKVEPTFIDIDMETIAKSEEAKPQDTVTAPTMAEEVAAEETVVEEEVLEDFHIVLNGRSIALEPRSKKFPHEFIELMAIANIDLDNPPPSGDMILTLNGKEVSFMDVIHDGDVAVIKWADK